MPHILFENASLAFQPGGPPAIQDISLSVDPGEVLVVLGPSGCGKTTLLRLIAGLLHPSAGRVLVKGSPPRTGQDSALVFQSFRLLPWKTVAGNVGFALPYLGSVQREARVAQYLEVVGLSRVAGALPRALSGGMQQRVALARALAAETDILLMDEPFASLDAQTRELMQGEVSKLSRLTHEGRPRTIVFVTHSVDEALVLGDRVLLMSPQPGRVADVLTVPFARQPGDARLQPGFAALRERLWDQLKQMVLSDPQSDFFGRGPSL